MLTMFMFLSILLLSYAVEASDSRELVLHNGKNEPYKFSCPLSILNQFAAIKDMHDALGDANSIEYCIKDDFSTTALSVQKLCTFVATKEEQQKEYIKECIQDKQSDFLNLLRTADRLRLEAEKQKQLISAVASVVPNAIVEQLNPYFLGTAKQLPEGIPVPTAEKLFLAALPLLDHLTKLELQKMWYPKQYESKAFETFRQGYKKTEADTRFATFAESREFCICNALGCSIWQFDHCVTFESQVIWMREFTAEIKKYNYKKIIPLLQILDNIWWQEYLHIPFLSVITKTGILSYAKYYKHMKNNKMRLYDIDVRYFEQDITIKMVDDMPIPYNGLYRIKGKYRIPNVTLEHAKIQPYSGLIGKENFLWCVGKDVFARYIVPVSSFVLGMGILYKVLSFLNNRANVLIEAIIEKEPLQTQYMLGLMKPNLVSVPKGSIFSDNDYYLAQKVINSKISSVETKYGLLMFVPGIAILLGGLAGIAIPILVICDTLQYSYNNYNNVKLWQKFLSDSCFSCHLTVKRPENQ